MAEESKIEAKLQGERGELRPGKKAYTSPALRRLGSVRDLTLGQVKGCGMDGLKKIKLTM